MRATYSPAKIIVLSLLVISFRGAFGASPSSSPAPAVDPTEPLVDVTTLDPTIVLDMRYARPDNFLKQAVYDSPTCLLRRSVAERLVNAQRALAARGLRLKVWDAYRPHSIQRKMWKIKSDARFVAPPYQGSKHSRGAAVDVTLVDSDGRELDMGTEFDEFSSKAFPQSPDVSSAARKNRELLRDVMEGAGFRQLSTEWWHFEGPGAKEYPILDVPLRAR